ncbi:MAG: hypothetical protein O3B37_06105 [Proteobacteria bacterium]|nr:hypothetical protein [Pseudomonadota bacterium]
MHRNEARSVCVLAADEGDPTIPQSSREDSPLKERDAYHIGVEHPLGAYAIEQ